MNRHLHTIHTAAGAKQACTYCGRCKALCPAGIDIPTVIQACRRYEEKGLPVIKLMPAATGPEDCIECGACTACCPEKIAVKALIRELAMRRCQYGSHSACVSAH